MEALVLLHLIVLNFFRPVAKRRHRWAGKSCELTDRQYEIWKAMQAANESEEPRYHRREVRSLSAREEKHGTVGAVAIDMSDMLAAATSTGGIYNKYPGRVGDSPLVGCGFYADEQ